MNSNSSYSIVVPVYNSELSLQRLYEEISNTLSAYSFEVIFADDGSTDNSWQVIRKLKNENPSRITAIQLQKNYGQQAASLCAFRFCKGEFTITIDDDLQYSPSDILVLIQNQKQTNADVVYGVSDTRHQSAIRNMGSKFARAESRIFDGNENRASSFRLIRHNIIKSIAVHNHNSFISIDRILKWYSAAFSFVQVSHHPRLHGRSGYSFAELFRIYFKTHTSYSVIPLKIMTYFGFTFSVIFLLLGARYIYMKMVYAVPIGFTSIIVTVLFCSSIILFYLGIIGQYLFNIYINQQNKPLYCIKEVIK